MPKAAAEAATDPIARYQAIVDAADRTDADRALDAGRHPAELLAFAGIEAGMKVAELAAGGGYTAELLARAVGPSGVVYGHNTPWILERFAEKPWTERLQRDVMKNVVRVDREFDAPLPPEVRDLDAILFVLFYHDTVWMGTDRAGLNRSLFAALKPGGSLVIVDHASRDGQGVSEAKTLHRIEQSVVEREVAAAGFRLDATSPFLHDPADTRDWNAAPSAAGERRGTSHRFALRFVKP